MVNISAVIYKNFYLCLAKFLLIFVLFSYFTYIIFILFLCDSV